MSSKVKFINIICTEPGIQKFYHDYLAANKLFGKYDTIQYENPILDFFDSAKIEAMMERIRMYVEDLHGADTIVLFDHLNCGAYKRQYKFKDREEEIKVHKENNAKVVKLIGERFPDLKIDVKYIVIKDDETCEWLKED